MRTTVRRPFDEAAREGIRLLVHTIESLGARLPRPQAVACAGSEEGCGGAVGSGASGPV